MRNYLNLLQNVLDEGLWQDNRTGIRTKRVIGGMLEFDLQDGFPLLTTKKIFTNQMIGELIGFIRGYTNAADFRAIGCTWWDANANQNEQWLANPHRKGIDDLGLIYGHQYRNWISHDGTIDQLKVAIDTIINNPTSRRIIVTAWNPADIDKAALPPCHVMYQFLPDPKTKELSLTFTMRSCDLFLGAPMNIASYALLLEIAAKATGYKAKKLVAFMSDLHIYEDHIDAVKEQLTRVPLELPTIHITNPLTGVQALELIEPTDIKFINYASYKAIPAKMAV